MVAYLIADITVHDLEQFMEYVRQVPAFVEKHGGQYRVRGGEPESQEGSWQPQRLVIIEFPSKDDALAFLNDPDYQPIAAIRHAAASTSLIVAEGISQYQ